MKKFALVLLALALLAGGAALWGFARAQLDMRVENVQVLPAADYREEFDRLAGLLRSGAARGLVYDPALTGNAEDYVILQYTIEVSNRGFIGAEMLEAQIVPVKGDVMCYSQQEALGQDVNLSFDVPAGQTARYRCYLLTRKDLYGVRDIRMSYYIWGNPFFIKLTYG